MSGFLVPSDFSAALEISNHLAKSNLVPKDYRGKPYDILVAIAHGSEIGLSTIQSLHAISVINGRATIWGDGMLALVLGHPDCEDLIEEIDEDSLTAKCTVSRKGREPVVRSFSKADATKAGLWSKAGPWSTYPKRMLQMRARSWAIRDSFSDALRGIQMREEVEDYDTGFRQNKKAKLSLGSPIRKQLPEKQTSEEPVVPSNEGQSKEPLSEEERKAHSEALDLVKEVFGEEVQVVDGTKFDAWQDHLDFCDSEEELREVYEMAKSLPQDLKRKAWDSFQAKSLFLGFDPATFKLTESQKST